MGREEGFHGLSNQGRLTGFAPPSEGVPLYGEGARKFDELSYIEVLNRKLKVMDSAAISLCMDNNLPIIVFNLMEKGNIKRVVSGESIGTLVSGGKR